MYQLGRFEERFGSRINIRVANVDDSEDIFASQNIAFPADPTNLTVGEIRDFIGHEEHTFIVGFFEDKFAGYVATHSKKYYPWTNGNSLVVADEYAGKGIGAFLLRDAIISCRKLVIRIFVEKNNFRAIRLYKKFGFFCVQKIPRHYENGDDALVMLKWTFHVNN
ncbi:MAG: GNAT family N-acetyltransferase [Alphaproteobacteria bacterium]|nr:GNAT family N-acetyltransferase [Alphaproteobacteria bacterium]